MDRQYVVDNLPVDLNTCEVDKAYWEKYSDCPAQQELQTYFCAPLAAALGLSVQ